MLSAVCECILLTCASTDCRFKSEYAKPPARDSADAKAAAAAAAKTRAAATYDPNCCSLCGEELDAGHYTNDGWVARRRGSSSSAGLVSPDVSDDDGPDDDHCRDDDYQPGKRRRHQPSKSKQKPSPKSLNKMIRRCKQPRHADDLNNAGHQADKQQQPNKSSRRTSQKQRSQGGDQCIPYPGADGFSAAAAAGGGGGGVEGGSSSSRSCLVCSACLRDSALQEVHEPCGTTLIVVPSNILVQVGAVLACPRWDQSGRACWVM